MVTGPGIDPYRIPQGFSCILFDGGLPFGLVDDCVVTIILQTEATPSERRKVGYAIVISYPLRGS